MHTLELYIPMMPPSVNNCYKRNRFGGMRLSKDGVDFKRIVAYKVKRDAMKLSLSEKLSLEIEFHSPKWLTKKGLIARVDVSNLIKIAEDALMEALGLDDKNVFELRVLKVPSSKSMIIYRLKNV